MNKTNIQTVQSLIEEVDKRRDAESKLTESLKGIGLQNLSTIIIIPTPWISEEKKFLNCGKCKHKNEYTFTSINGLNPTFVASLKNLIKPMNVPITPEIFISGREVGDAYTQAVEMILANPQFNNFKFLLTIEHDNIIPFIPGTLGPLMMLYESMDKYDVVGGLYYLKGDPPVPLIYGDPKEGRDSKAGMFKVRYDWKPGDIVECNGMGMGFTLFKLNTFKDKRLKKPYFKTVNEHTKKGPKLYTQDLYFFEKIRKLGYKVAIDTRVKLAHMDLKTGRMY